ncbi:ABC transporter ATP-binding protein [Paenibacillus doosanensis]|uniref:ABC-type transporter ATP-binding protein EcsA n=1 Tax=Paenibacillus konkukensis TaxID=2020716 RepID=A0ABY4RVQ8_9BACL|nr:MULTISPECIES: ABC transporter ATP-binding protein [Paenibacillus]MCS7460718.1 ABC transporter ATP-binding protein [Paenibacillus doosanensis]UQZ85900.1 ABC-type transporter ATP-binding protein EcsA [Paenibacillus konkukensis]
MKAILEVDHVTGGYSRQQPVLHDLSFHMQPGEMIGLIGLNGAGKSTTIKHILGLMLPHKGEIRLKGSTLADSREQYRKTFAYVPESPLLYEELTVQEHLELAAMAYQLDKPTYEQRMRPLLEQFQMESLTGRMASHLSKGMRQKVMIMCAFLVQPELYIIDEPFLGLDPLSMRSLLELMVSVKQSGASILISSHILATIERYCDRFLVMHQGKLIVSGPVPALQQAAGLPGAPLDDVFYELVTRGGSR